MEIDTSLDFRKDAGKTKKGDDRDPDLHSPKLRRYHKFLWSKPLPDGRRFDLDDTTKGAYLHHSSDVGEFWLASDSVMQTFTRWKIMNPVTERLPAKKIAWFKKVTYTIGGMLIFPANKVEGRMTINGARGCNHRIRDRMDLTLECIRRHYLGESSPLADTLQRYRDFFALFGDFRGYVDFFLLDDLLTPEQTITFFTQFDDFQASPFPADVETYVEFMRRSVQFLEARNRRIANWATERNASP